MRWFKRKTKWGGDSLPPTFNGINKHGWGYIHEVCEWCFGTGSREKSQVENGEVSWIFGECDWCKGKGYTEFELWSPTKVHELLREHQRRGTVPIVPDIAPQGMGYVQAAATKQEP